VSLEYLICDGASTDDTLAVARASGDARVTVSSEPDSGLYDAVARGLRMATGDVVAYLNAGDFYAPTAFDVVADLLARPEVAWLTGWGVEVSDTSVPVHVMQPFRYTRRGLERGVYGTLLPFVPQESTFWRRELVASVDLARLARFRLAGDAYLWRCFSQRAGLHIASTYLGAFRRHPGQLSEDRVGYLAELRALSLPMTAVDRLTALAERPLWHAPRRIRKALNATHFFEYDHARARWV